MGTHPIFESDFDCLTDMSAYNLCDDDAPRLNILRNNTRMGRVIPFGQYEHLDQLKHEIGEHLRMAKVRHLFNPHGCEITSLALIRDDDVLIAAAHRERFQKPSKKEISSAACAQSAFFTMFKTMLKLALKVMFDFAKEQFLQGAITAT